MFVDSHCHLNLPELHSHIDEYLSQMQQNQVDYALCISTEPKHFQDIIAMTDVKHNIFGSIGVHPDCHLEHELSESSLSDFLDHKKIIAIGETGLDYYKPDYPDKIIQQKRLELHIAVANKYNLPLVIHTRNAIDDTIEILHSCCANSAVMHCFTENITNAKKCLDLGFYISISGIVTFKNAVAVQELASYVPSDRLLIETDAPFLAPHPFRGKVNHPALIKYTAECIANIRGITVEDLGFITTNNFFRLFAKAQQ